MFPHRRHVRLPRACRSTTESELSAVFACQNVGIMEAVKQFWSFSLPYTDIEDYVPGSLWDEAPGRHASLIETGN